MNKEDIWISRVALPICADETRPSGSAWNIYSPKWAPVTIGGDDVRLEDRDPYDYAAATLLFPQNAANAITFDCLAEQSGHALHVEIAGTDHVQIVPAEPNAWESRRIDVRAPSRITFRTGPYRGIGGAHPVDPETDRPHDPIAFRIRNVRPTP
jgi:hypothetical protein